MIKKLYELLDGFDKGCEDFIGAYCALVSYTLQHGGFKEAIKEEILSDDNIFAQRSQTFSYDAINDKLKNAVDHDVTVLNRIVTNLSAGDVLETAANQYENMRDYILALPQFDAGKKFDITDARVLYNFYHKNGYGFFAKNGVCIYKNKKIIGIKHPDTIRLSDLKGYEKQKNTLLNNTRLFLSGEEANNALLYGDKGTGKSSTVKAIHNEFKDDGLRLIEIRKEDLCDFHELCETLSASPFKFIVFLDDVSFAKEDDSFSTLKAVIEGGIVKRPDNVIIYATSNRAPPYRREFFGQAGRRYPREGHH